MASENRSSIEELINRVALLEKRERRRQRWTFSIVLVLGGVFICGQASQQDSVGKVPEVIEARAFKVLDQEGRVRAELSADKIGSMLKLFDEDGNLGIYASAFSWRNELQLRSKGRIVGEFFNTPDGAILRLQEARSGNQMPTLDKANEIQKRREAAGLPRVPFTAEEKAEVEAAKYKRASLTLSVYERAPAIDMQDKDGTVRASWKVDSDGKSALSLYDSKAVNRLFLTAQASGPAAVGLLGPDEKISGFFGSSGDWGGTKLLISDGERILWSAP